MGLRIVILAFALLVAGPARADAVAWRNGWWFDGATFRFGTRYTVDGRFSAGRPAKVDRTVELAHRWVVPAYGDAHHHGIDSADGVEDKATVFLEAGVFYVKNPNAIAALLTPAVRARLGRLSMSVAFGGLTVPGGHPEPLHRYLAGLGVFPGLGPDDLEDRAYFLVPDEASLEAKWPRIVADRPDFIKVFVLFTDEYDGREPLRRETDGTFHRGVPPNVLHAAVRKAHAAGLRVSAHIDTARDFRHAVEAGVDEINHLPQPDPRFSPDLSAYVIDAETARLAASKGITVVTTASTTERLSPSLPEAWRPAMRDNQRENLRRLLAAGVKVAIGSDGISGERRFVTARDEARFIARHRLMEPLALLRAWSVETPRTIFPGRKLGALEPGCEADFLVLAGDPLDDPENLHRIHMRVQSGDLLPDLPRFSLGR